MFKIALPNPSDYGDIPSFIAQMKIVIKAAEKSYEQLTKDLTKENDKNFFAVYRFPRIDFANREQDKEGFVQVHVDEESDAMQDIELEIDYT